MQISLSPLAGFCGGVNRAYSIIMKAVDDPAIKKPICVYGSLVHNQDVVKKLIKRGVEKIAPVDNIQKLEKKLKREIGTLVITAHGHGPSIYEVARRLHINVIDTTCPKVTKVQKLAEKFARDAQVLIVGDKEHKEVRGIFEWSYQRAIVVEGLKDLRKAVIDPKRAIYVLAQTTQNRQLVEKVYKRLLKYHKNAQLIDTICDATRLRQQEIMQMAKSNDVVVIIGSAESANSNRLWELSKAKNKQSYFIENAFDLKKNWFIGVEKIGVSAGASTPKWVIDEVMSKLKSLKTCQNGDKVVICK